MNKTEILAGAMQRAERFGPLAAGTLRPYDEEKRQPALYSRWLDPLLLWSLNRFYAPAFYLGLYGPEAWCIHHDGPS